MGVVKILVTTDGSNLSDKAVDSALELAQQFDGTVIAMTAVIAPPLGNSDSEDPVILARLESISKKAQDAGVQCTVVAQHCESIAQGILKCAQEHDVNYIVMASRGLGTLGSLVLGSETQKVLSEADRPVLVVR